MSAPFRLAVQSAASTLLAIVLFASSAFAQAPAPQQADAVVTRDDAGHVTVRAVRLTEPLRLDGGLDEAI